MPQDRYLWSLRCMPMLVPPRPWDGDGKRGGYLTFRTPLARCHPSQSQLIVAAQERGELRQVHNALNALGELPW